MTEPKLMPKQFGFLGSAIFFLFFATSAVIFGFIINRVATRWVLLGLALVWALAQFPMLGSAGFLTLVACHIILGAGAGPAFSVALTRCSVISGFPMHSGPCISQGSEFGVIVAGPALNWAVVNHSWH